MLSAQFASFATPTASRGTDGFAEQVFGHRVAVTVEIAIIGSLSLLAFLWALLLRLGRQPEEPAAESDRGEIDT